MKTTNDYLDDLKIKYSLRSDYALARKLGIMTGHMTTYRKNRSHFDDNMAVRVAELLEIDPAEVLAAMNVERTKCPAAKVVWERVAKSFSTGLMAVFIAVLLNFAPAPVQANQFKNSPIMYIMLNNIPEALLLILDSDRRWSVIPPHATAPEEPVFFLPQPPGI